MLPARQILKNSGMMNDLSDMPERAKAIEDLSNNDVLSNERAGENRRRTPRFSCGGRAEINCLPATGILVPGSIRDLGLGGCSIETPRPMNRGELAEFVLRVNAASFRATGAVKTIRGRSIAGVEFVHLSAGGKDLLEELLMELARLQALMTKLKAHRREEDDEALRSELEQRTLRSSLLSQRFSLLQPASPASSKCAERKASGPARNEEERLIVPVNLFG